MGPEGRFPGRISGYVQYNGGQASMAGGLPLGGHTVAAATLGPPGPCVPQNPLGVEFGRGPALYVTGNPANGMPGPVIDPLLDGQTQPLGDVAGTFVDPNTGLTYVGYTDPMPEPVIMRERPVLKLGEPSRALEQLTGVSSVARPPRREVLADFSDALEGIQLPQQLLEMQIRSETANRNARDNFFANRESQAGYNDTHWDGYIGTTYVMRPVLDTQTLADNDQTNTVVAPWRPVASAPEKWQGVAYGTQWGGHMQPAVTVLGEDRVHGGAPRAAMVAATQMLGGAGGGTGYEFTAAADRLSVAAATGGWVAPNTYAGGGQFAAPGSIVQQPVQAQHAAVDTGLVNVAVGAVPTYSGAQAAYTLVMPGAAAASDQHAPNIGQLAPQQAPTAGGAMIMGAPSIAPYAGDSAGQSVWKDAARVGAMLVGLDPGGAQALQTSAAAGVQAMDSVRAASDGHATQALGQTFQNAPALQTATAVGVQATDSARAASDGRVTQALAQTAQGLGFPSALTASTATMAAASHGRADGVDATFAPLAPSYGLAAAANGMEFAAAAAPVAQGLGGSPGATTVALAGNVAAAALLAPGAAYALLPSAGTGVRAADDSRVAPMATFTPGAAAGPSFAATVPAGVNGSGFAQDSQVFESMGSLFPQVTTAAPSTMQAAGDGRAAHADASISTAPGTAPHAFHGFTQYAGAPGAAVPSSGYARDSTTALHSVAPQVSAGAVGGGGAMSAVQAGHGAYQDARLVSAMTANGGTGLAGAMNMAGPGPVQGSGYAGDQQVVTVHGTSAPLPYVVAGVGQGGFTAVRSADTGADDAAATQWAAQTFNFLVAGGANNMVGVRQGDTGADEYVAPRQSRQLDLGAVGGGTGVTGPVQAGADGYGAVRDMYVVSTGVSRNGALGGENYGSVDGTLNGRIATGTDFGGYGRMLAADTPTSRLSNDRSLGFQTGGAGMGAQLPTFAQADRGTDASAAPLVHTAQYQAHFESNLAAHPSAYGVAAEYRNSYYTGLRPGVVLLNQETARMLEHPGRQAMASALAAQALRTDAANACPDPVMRATAQAYESDAYDSCG